MDSVLYERTSNIQDVKKTDTEIIAECPMCGRMMMPDKDTFDHPDLGDYYIDRMLETMTEWHSKPRKGYHVSDVVMCPRQRVFREIDPRPIDAKTVGIYSAGKAIHEALQCMFLSDKRMFEREKYLEYQDIQGSVDLYDRKRNIPIEFKTSRASDLKEPKTFHVEQLKYYMAMLDALDGYILYQFLLHFGDRPFKVFRITMGIQERNDQRIKLVREIHALKRAIEAGNPALARSVGEDASLNWLCRECPYIIECKKINDAAAAT
jgi:hypothetical protein